MKFKYRLAATSVASLALIGGPLTTAPVFAAGTIYVNNLSGTSDDASCLAAVATHQTIQSAVDDASDGDTIIVCPSTYVENVNDHNKTLTITGQGTPTVDGNGGTAFTLGGGGTSLDGFQLTGATAADQTPAVLVTGPNVSVNHSVFTGDGQAAIIVSTGAAFHDDIVRDPAGGNPGGFFFNSNQGSGSTVDSSTFSGPLTNGAVNVANPNTPATGIVISDNTFDATSGGNLAVLGGTRGVVIRGNTVTGDTDSSTAILLLGDDSDYSITQNRITGVNASAVSVTGGFGYPSNGGGDISQNAFKNNLRGINVTDASGTITAHLNIMTGNNTGGTSASPNAAIRNTTNAAVSAANNFYGCNGGPGAAGCDDVLGNVNANPFLILTTSVGDASLAPGDTTQLTADLKHNSAGDTVSGTVLDNVETATFMTSGGTVNPTTAPIISGRATTTLTAGSSSGTFTATATVENASASKTFTVSGGGTGGGGGKPRISISDANTTEGNSGTHAIKFTVRLSKRYTSAVTVRYSTVDGTARAGSDYVKKSGTLTIAKDKTTGVISVQVKGDRAKEGSETFVVTLTNPTNATISDPNGSGVIVNDD